MNDRYDVIVVGAGPGGSWAAKSAAESGASVRVLEKDREAGIPGRCAEGVSEEGLAMVVEIRDKWIAQVIRGGRLVAPDGTVVESMPDELGYVLHRRLFDPDLTELAAQAGAEILTKAYARGLIRENGTTSGVHIRHIGRDISVRASIVIAADGVESRVGRWAGLNTVVPYGEMASCAQMTLGGINIDPQMVEFYFGEHVAPGGYLWIFPKGPKSANVGLGIAGRYGREKKAIHYLEDFVNNKFPHASRLVTVAGGVPLVATLKTITADGLMLVGDAARQANPVTGGGIVNAMIAGKIAGKTAAEAIRKGDVSAKQLEAYPKAWRKAEGNNNAMSYKIRQVIDRFSDDDLNRLAHILLEFDPRKRTPFAIFKAALRKHPKLILDAAKIFI